MLSELVYYYGGGMCNHCGHSSGDSLCDVVERVRRKAYVASDIKNRDASLFEKIYDRWTYSAWNSKRPFRWEYR